MTADRPKGVPSTPPVKGKQENTTNHKSGKPTRPNNNKPIR